MTKKLNTLLMNGYVNKDLKIKYSFTLETESKFQTVYESQKGDIYLSPYYSITITEGFQRPSVFIQGRQYHGFVKLLDKSIQLIRENFYELFPNPNQMEFEVDSSVLERFITEKAMSSVGITIVPCVWVDQQQLSYPGIQITTSSTQGYDLIKIPFEDAISMSQMFNTMDINTLTMQSLQMMARFMQQQGVENSNI
jgi:hypothetical protein